MSEKPSRTKATEAEEDENALFDRLERLVAAIPCMQEKSQSLSRMRAVKLAKEALDRRNAQKESLRHFQQRLDRAEERMAAATEAGDEQGAMRANAEIYEYGNKVSLRNGALKFSEYRLSNLLREYGFVSEEEVAREIEPDQAIMEALEQELESFKRDYAEILSACQALEEEK